MAYCGYITNLKNVRAHPNADRMLLADCFGNTVCVGLDAKENDVVIYFPTDGQLSVEYAEKHNLVRRKDENGNNIGGYLDPDKRNIKAISLRGAKSDGLVMPVASLEYTGVDMSTLTVGTTIDTINGHEICCKYIPKSRNHVSSGNSNGKTRKIKAPIAPLFEEHVDTSQLAYNLDAFKPGDEIEITLKLHGTSQRTGDLPKFKGYTSSFPWARAVLKNVNPDKEMGRIAKKIYDSAMRTATPIYDWGYVTGTRRVVLNDYDDSGYYGSNEFRGPHAKAFEGKLWKGETVYYEVVGYTTTGAPIMGTGSTPKEYQKQYGKNMEFSYGCEPHPMVHEGYNDSTYGYQDVHIEYKYPQSEMYVYRMTMTNEDGNVVEYTPDFMRYRCEQMGIKTVPVMWKGTIPHFKPLEMWSEEDKKVDIPGFRPKVDAGEYVKWLAEQYYDGPDPIGKTHVREGVVVRIINRPKFTAYKHKNWCFKVVEGIVKESAEAPDMEEAQEVTNDI